MEFIQKNIIKIEDIFKENDEIVLDEKKLELFLNGVKLNNNKRDGIYKIYSLSNGFIRNR